MNCPVHKVATNQASWVPGMVPPEVLDFVSKKGVQPSFSYQDIWNEEHSTAFAVAKATELDVVQSMQDAVVEALREGLPFSEFQKRITPILADKGWWGRKTQVDPLTGEKKEVLLGSPARLQVIYDTNVRTARAAGQWQRIQSAKKALPYLRYRHGNPERPRPDHVSWDGRVLPVDHPWWDYAYPPNGYRCTCWVEQVSNSQAKRMGITPDDDVDTDPIVVENPRTGAKTVTVKGVQPTFAYNAGKSRWGGLVQAGVVKRPPRRGQVPAPPKPPKPKKQPAPLPPPVEEPAPLNPEQLSDIETLLKSEAVQQGDFSAVRSLVADQIKTALPNISRVHRDNYEVVVDNTDLDGGKHAGVHNLGTGKIAFSEKVAAVLQSPRPRISEDLELLRAQLSSYIGRELTAAEREERSQVTQRIAELEVRLSEERRWYQEVHTVFHEELHGHGPMANRYADTYIDEAAVIEEVTTETLSNELLPQAQSVAYKPEIHEMVTAIRDAYKSDVPRLTAEQLLIRASARYKSTVSATDILGAFMSAIRQDADVGKLKLDKLEAAIRQMRLKSVR